MTTTDQILADDRGWNRIGNPVEHGDMSNGGAALLTLDELSPAEQQILRQLQAQMITVSPHNQTRRDYYDASVIVRDLGIAIPPQLKNVQTVVGWPGTTVDVLEERLNMDGFYTTSGVDLGLDEIVEDNQLITDASPGHIDALTCGITFITVGAGQSDEPDVLVTVESPLTTTALWDYRRRRLGAGLTIIPSNDPQNPTPQRAALYLPDQTITIEPDGDRAWRVVERDQHQLGRALIARLVNRPRRSGQYGRSEITRPVMAYTDAAVRTILGMEVNREFYVAPQRWMMGATEDSFVNMDGERVSPWTAVMGRMWVQPRDEDTGELPEVGQFPQSSPGPFLEQVRGLSQLLAAEAAIPPSYLGFITDQPSSADAIRAGEARLVMRAERRQRTFGAGWADAAYLALLVRDAEEPPERPRVLWGNAATPTRAAAADEAVKLIGAGVLPADSSVTMDRLDFTVDEQQRLVNDRRRAEARQTVALIAGSAAAARQSAQETPGDVAEGDGTTPSEQSPETGAQSPRTPLTGGDRADR